MFCICIDGNGKHTLSVHSSHQCILMSVSLLRIKVNLSRYLWCFEMDWEPSALQPQSCLISSPSSLLSS